MSYSFRLYEPFKHAAQLLQQAVLAYQAFMFRKHLGKQASGKGHESLPNVWSIFDDTCVKVSSA